MFEYYRYLEANPDLLQAWNDPSFPGITPEQRAGGIQKWAEWHYNNWGQQEGRPLNITQKQEQGMMSPAPTQATQAPTTAATGPQFDPSGMFLGGAKTFNWGDFPIETGTVVNDYGIESLLRANVLPGQEGFTNYQSIDQLRQAQPGLFRIAVPGGAPGQVAYLEMEKTSDGRYAARETGGHTSIQDMLDNRVHEDDNSILGMGAGMDLLALGGLGLWAGGAFGGGGLLGGSEAALMDSAMGAGGFNTAAPGGVFNVAGTGLTAGEIAAMDAAMGAGGYNTAAAGGVFAPSVAGAGAAAATTAGKTAATSTLANAVIPGTTIPLSTALPIAGAVLGAATKPKTAGDDVGGYNNTPINQAIVNQYGNMPAVTPPKYQGFESFSMPQGLLDDRLMQIRNNGRGLL